MSQSSDLTDRDRELCLLLGERQGADRPSQLTGLITALAVAKRFAYACPPARLME
jgi:hypothetical protein